MPIGNSTEVDKHPTVRIFRVDAYQAHCSAKNCEEAGYIDRPTEEEGEAIAWAREHIAKFHTTTTPGGT